MDSTKNEERIVIEPPIQRSQRFAGWLLLGMISLTLGLLAFLMMLSPPRIATIKSGELPILIFCGAMLFFLFLGAAICGARMALETQTWTAGHDSFEWRSEIFGWARSKTIRATAWRLERQNYRGNISYVLSPVGPRVAAGLMPFYSTSSARKALQLGRQLALATGWPLRLSSELQRLEKELEL